MEFPDLKTSVLVKRKVDPLQNPGFAVTPGVILNCDKRFPEDEQYDVGLTHAVRRLLPDYIDNFVAYANEQKFSECQLHQAILRTLSRPVTLNFDVDRDCGLVIVTDKAWKKSSGMLWSGHLVKVWKSMINDDGDQFFPHNTPESVLLDLLAAFSVRHSCIVVHQAIDKSVVTKWISDMPFNAGSWYDCITFRVLYDCKDRFRFLGDLEVNRTVRLSHRIQVGSCGDHKAALSKYLTGKFGTDEEVEKEGYALGTPHAIFFRGNSIVSLYTTS